MGSILYIEEEGFQLKIDTDVWAQGIMVFRDKILPAH